MPKSRNRRRKPNPKPGRNRKSQPARRQPTPPSQPDPPALDESSLMPYFAYLADVDEAERCGDAAGALDLIEDRLFGPDGKVWWRPQRIYRLSQLVTFRPWLPGWVTSRWLLEQALQDLHPSMKSAVARAMHVAAEVQGGIARIPHPTGEDPRVSLMDHCWVFRQCLLYEYGGLEQFLRRTPADLVASADRVDAWAKAPMGGYRYVKRAPGVTTWADLATGELVETANIGSAALLVVGQHVIGRLVPVDGGRMFETVPLPVGEGVARAVAADPSRWLDALLRARDAGEPVLTRYRFGFVTDVPDTESLLAVYANADPNERPLQRATHLLDVARAAFAEDPNDDPEAVDLWACLAAEVLQPGMFVALSMAARPADADLLARLGRSLAEPAASICRQLANNARNVA